MYTNERSTSNVQRATLNVQWGRRTDRQDGAIPTRQHRALQFEQEWSGEEDLSYPPNLPNEASSKTMKCTRKIRGVNMLCTLQKNDNWLCFPGMWGGKRDG
jgi:hypothetical protein